MERDYFVVNMVDELAFGAEQTVGLATMAEADEGEWLPLVMKTLSQLYLLRWFEHENCICEG